MAKYKKKMHRDRDGNDNGWNKKGHDDIDLKKKPVKQFTSVTGMTPNQKKYIVDVNNHEIIFCSGPAGTGKTAVAVGIALQHLLASTPTYDRLIVMRPAKEACDEKIGFLPGGLEDKMGPWAAPIMDNMEVFIDKNAIKNLFFHGKVEIIPMAYARGRSLNNAFIIIDEAQNCSPKQIYMALTRIGKNSKMVINGDINQSDHSGKSGLLDGIDRLRGMAGVAVVEMDASDIVRNKMIGEIVLRYSDMNYYQ